MRKSAAILALLLWPILVLGQTGAYSGHTFVGGVPATTSGMNSSNYMDGIIPGASITVYLTGTTTKATIYEDGSNTPLSNPFFSNLAPGTNPGGFIFWSAQNQGLDIQAQGGMGNASCTTPPLCYPTATTLQVDVYPNNSFTPIIVPYPGVTSPGTGGLAGINWALYPCTGNATTDLFMINTYLATPGTYLYLFGNCATNNQIILFSNDTLDWTGQTITSSMPYSPDGNGVDEAAITNEAVVNPTTVGPFSCALTAGSPLVSCSTANFTNADQNQSFVCTGALGGGVDLHTSIEAITSGTSLYLYDAAGSTITSGDFNCTEQIRDHDIHILAGTLSMTSVYDTPFVSPHEVLIGHVNRLDMEDGYWIEPDGSSNWHMALFDISDTIVHGTHHYSASGFGQDGVHFLGPARNISVDSVVCNTYDDCVAMQTSLSSGTFHNTNGSVSAWSIHNIQGSGGSAGVALYDDCVNASGTCINSPLSNGVIDTVLAGPEGDAVNGNGFGDPVRIANIQEAASDIGTVAQIDNISINHIKGANYYSEDQIAIGSETVNEYYGTISISDVAPIIHASGGNNGSVRLLTPSSPYTLNIGTLAVNDLGYTSSLLPLVNTSGNTAAITNFYADNPNAIYRIYGAVTNKYIAGILVPGTTPVSGGTNTYLLYDNNHFLGEEAATTNILTDWSNNVGSASANQKIPFCSSVASYACTGFTLEYLNTSALLDWTNSGVAGGYVPIWNAVASKWTPGGVVNSINSSTGPFTFSFASGAGSCSGTTCTFTGAGSVTNFILGTWPSWLTPSVATSTTTPTLAVAATTGLAANYFLATPNGSTGALSPRLIVAADLPTLTTWSLPSFMSASPSTLTAGGTQTFSFINQAANCFFAGPASGSAATPTCRAIVNADFPNTLAPTIAVTNMTGTGPFNISGTAATATAAAATPTQCTSGQYSTGIASSFAANCAQVAYSQISGAPSALPPNGTAGGDLSGSYPSPSVTKINGGAVPASASVLGTNSSGQPIAATAAQIVSALGSTSVSDITLTWLSTSTTGLTLAGTAPASVSTATGTTATTLFNVNGVAGGATSNASGTGGVGSSPAITSGAGGAGTGTNASGGAGGNITLTTGVGGSKTGSGTAGANGQVLVSLGGGTAYPVLQVICSGQISLSSGSPISSGGRATNTLSCTGLSTSTDSISCTFSGDTNTVTGYAPSATGAVLSLKTYVTSGTINVDQMNNTASSITPSAATLNCKGLR